MKKIVSLFFTILITTIGFSQDKVKFQADIANRNGDIIYINNAANKTIKEIKVNDKGIFEDSFEVIDGNHMMFDGVEYVRMYLKNGYDLKLKLDAKKVIESTVFKGKGSVENNFITESVLLDKKFNYDEILALNEEEFNKTITKRLKDDTNRIDNANLDPEYAQTLKMNLEANFAGFKKYYDKSKETNKLNNTVAPLFDYENFAGGKTSLESLKGKYVYIDVWATWCGPCVKEIPFLKTAEEKYHGKNIEFVSISVDSQKDYEKWKTFVNDKQLGGIQLYADKSTNSDFIKAFGINSIPRFILIDPSGNVMYSDAMRPSNPKLLEKLDELLK